MSLGNMAHDEMDVLGSRKSLFSGRCTDTMAEETDTRTPQGILKPTLAYDDNVNPDEQFFPGEQADSTTGVDAVPISSTSTATHVANPTEDDYDDPDGGIFAGPAAQSIPTSYSTFRMRARSRGELDRMSREWEREQLSDDDQSGDDDGSDVKSTKSGKSRKSRKSSRSRSRRRHRSRSRRDSGASTDAAETTDAAVESDDAVSASRRRRRKKTRKSRSSRGSGNEDSSDEEEEARRSGFFQHLSDAIMGRPSMDRHDSTMSEQSRARSSRGRRSTELADDEDAVSARSESEGEADEDNDEDPYGPYGSSDTSSTSTAQSSSSQEDGGPRRRRGGGGFLGLPGVGDGMFGESRIDMDGSDYDDELSSIEENDGKRGSNAHQSIYILDEDLPLRFNGLTVSKLKTVLWWAGCVLSCGMLWLIGRWLPNIWIKSVGRPGQFDEASYIVVETVYHEPQVLPIQTLRFPRPLPLASIFPPSVKPPPAHRDDVAHPQELDEDNVPEVMLSGQTTPNGHSAAVAALTGSTIGPNGIAGKARKIKGPMIDQVHFVDYRYYRFMLHPEGDFRMIREWKDPSWSSVPVLRRGLPSVDSADRRALFGPNAIEIAARSTFQLLMDEVLHPFYIFQIFSILLWTVDDYYYYAFAIAVISVVSIVQTLIETKANVERMREMSRFSCPVRVLRGNEWVDDVSDSLVPGDVVDIAEAALNTFPADLVMLSGDAIVNESMLTGESVPVSKYPVEPPELPLLSRGGGEVAPELSRNIVFCGTKIIRVRKTVPPGVGASQPEAVAMVLRTGFNTTKGALVRSMLFPKPFGFAFYRDSFRFIGVLGLVAVVGFMASSVNFIKLGISWPTIVIRALDLVTIVVPPALPATMSIGTSFAIARLRKSGIFCISPNRVNIGGKINIVCFDKTGTLTEEGLDVLGVRSVVRSTNKFAEIEDDIDNVPIFGVADAKTPMLHALATCHALKIVDGEVIGDPLDLRMFEFTGWTLEEGKEGAARPKTSKSKSQSTSASSKVPERAATLVQTVVRPPGGESFKLEDAMKAGSKHAHFLELGVLRTFDFVSALRRMSVLVKKLKSNSVEAYVKGAPEVMSDICDPSTLPEDYEETLAYYTKHGFRVIALAGKSMPGLTWVKAQRLKREAVESDLRFLGIIVFENKLKPGTAPAIATLRAAHIPTRMVTGDNVRTAISVARECGMVHHQSRVYLPTFLKGNAQTPRSSIEWTNVEDETRKLDSYSLVPLDDDRSTFSGYSDERRDYHLAVSGDVFRWMMDYGALETLQRMLVKGVIFARMSPDEKHELVERLQGLGYTVGFCGDGANDCGALKAADVGLSLSEAEASVAAPFTSRQPDIRCFVDVIKEGRAALVTSFACFKFIALYSLTQFCTVTLLYSLASTLSDGEFLAIDLFIILPVAVTMARTGPYPRLAIKRPTANLVSKKVLSSIIGQIVIVGAFQVFVFFWTRSQPFYVPPVIDPDELDVASAENTALYLVSQFQYLITAFVFCSGPPYKRPWFTSKSLVVTFIALMGLCTWSLFTTGGPLFDVLELVDLPHEFHLELFLVVLANGALCWAYEEYGAQAVASTIKSWQRRWRRWRGTRKHQSKVYKAVKRSME
ncbi:hypothetical protein OIO90_003293 [Microbotryomycetes sp. JL221]|nr:hypothetical protein OIO90_003293 [Microbotryomycetes sp. JL221]